VSDVPRRILTGILLTLAASCQYDDWSLEGERDGGGVRDDSGQNPRDGQAQGDGAVGPMPTDGPSVAMVQKSDALVITVPGRYEIELVSSAGYQPARWRDLSAPDPTGDIGRAGGFVEPFMFGMGSANYGIATSKDPKLGDHRANAARALVKTSYVNAVNTIRTGTFRVDVEYVFWANGRVAVTAGLVNAGTKDENSDIFDYLEFGGLRVSELIAWSERVGCSKPSTAFMYQRSGGGNSNVVALSQSPDTDAHGNPGDAFYCFWDTYNKPPPFKVETPFVEQWELVVWPRSITADEIKARASDIRGPSAMSLGGADVPAYDKEFGAYTLKATGGPVTVRVAAAGGRFGPAFIVSNWQKPTFSIRRGNQMLASNDHPATTKATAYYDGDARMLMFSTTDTIAAGAADEDATFHIDP
jgi:hypothetical protein